MSDKRNKRDTSAKASKAKGGAKAKPKPKKRARKPDSVKAKATSEVQPARLEWLEERLATGEPTTKVVDAYMRKFKLSRRTGMRDVSRIYAKWEAEDEGDRPARRAELRADLRRALDMAMGYTEHRYQIGFDVETGFKTDLQAIPRIADRLAKLDGLDAPTKIEHKVDSVPDLSGLTDEQAEQLIRLLDAAEAAGAGDG